MPEREEVKFENPNGDVVSASNPIDVNDYRTRAGWTELTAGTTAAADETSQAQSRAEIARRNRTAREAQAQAQAAAAETEPGQ